MSASLVVQNWFKYLAFCNKSNAQGLRELNAALGETYEPNSLYTWRAGTVTPKKAVLDYMRLCCTRLVVEGELLRTISEDQANAIAKELS